MKNSNRRGERRKKGRIGILKNQWREREFKKAEEKRFSCGKEIELKCSGEGNSLESTKTTVTIEVLRKKESNKSHNPRPTYSKIEVWLGKKSTIRS